MSLQIHVCLFFFYPHQGANLIIVETMEKGFWSQFIDTHTTLYILLVLIFFSCFFGVAFVLLHVCLFGFPFTSFSIRYSVGIGYPGDDLIDMTRWEL